MQNVHRYSSFCICTGVIIQFNPALYSVTEGNSVDFIVELTGGTITRPVSFDFRTVDGSATGKIMTILI